MIVLTATTDNVQAVLGGSVTTNQMRCVASWRDITTTAYTPPAYMPTTTAGYGNLFPPPSTTTTTTAYTPPAYTPTTPTTTGYGNLFPSSTTITTRYRSPLPHCPLLHCLRL